MIAWFVGNVVFNTVAGATKLTLHAEPDVVTAAPTVVPAAIALPLRSDTRTFRRPADRAPTSVMRALSVATTITICFLTRILLLHVPSQVEATDGKEFGLPAHGTAPVAPPG